MEVYSYLLCQLALETFKVHLLCYLHDATPSCLNLLTELECFLPPDCDGNPAIAYSAAVAATMVALWNMHVVHAAISKTAVDSACRGRICMLTMAELN